MLDVADTLMLSRIQFAANISFHILFPTINIALCWILLFFKIRYDKTNDQVWMRAYRFWVKIFSLTFALGVVSGITMSFQFGTNWPGFMESVGNVAGPLLGYEVLTAFFLEATFLGVMLFGINRVSSRVHTFATALVAVGTTLSAFWILALNSWMQTPAGHEIRDGVVHVVDWWEVIFNPSFPYRLTHTLLASGLTAAFFMAGLSAYRLRQGDQKHAPLLALKTGIVVGAVLTPLQIFVGDLHGLNSFEYQPQKVAAIEGVWETQKGAPLLLFALPDEEARENRFEIGIPKLASLILTHDLDGEIKGLNEFGVVSSELDAEYKTEKINHPPMPPMFFGFRIMLAVGMLMLLLSLWGVLTMLRRQSFSPLYLRFMEWMTFSGWVASLAGWYVTEIGRQPWLVTGLLTTEQAVTTQPSSAVGLTLVIYLSIYAFLLWAYVHTLRVMCRKSVDVPEYELAPTDIVTNLPDDDPKQRANKSPSVLGGAEPC